MQEMASDIEIGGAIEFAAASAFTRAAHYRDQATRLREMADEEPIGRLRDRLRETADQYDELAEGIVARLSSN